MSDVWHCCGVPVSGPHITMDDVTPFEAHLNARRLCVNTIIWHPTNKSLCCIVSRKDDRTKFCFPGGKVDDADWPRDMAVLPEAVMAACRAGAVRETREECGLVVKPEDLEFVMGSSCFQDGRMHGRYAACFVAKAFTGELGTSEPIDVKWGRPAEVLAGPFGDLYRRVFAKMKTSESLLA